MILVDYSQVVIASVFSNKITNDISESLVRHIVLNTLRSYSKKYGNEYGKLIVCVDGKNTWRKSIFPPYKASRKKSRKESPVDWNELFSIMNTIQIELSSFLPYPVIQLERAEADDVIGVLVNKSAKDDKKTLIISSDKDFGQLQKYENITQYSPLKDSFIKIDNPQEFLFEHIIKGDSGDGVPNIFSNDDVFVVEGARQTPATKKKIEAWMTYLYSNRKDDKKIINDETERNFARNQMLIDLSQTPDDIAQNILLILEEETKRIEETFSGETMIQYMMKNKLKSLIECIDEFFIGQTQIGN